MRRIGRRIEPVPRPRVDDGHEDAPRLHLAQQRLKRRDGVEKLVVEVDQKYDELIPYRL